MSSAYPRPGLFRQDLARVAPAAQASGALALLVRGRQPGAAPVTLTGRARLDAALRAELGDSLGLMAADGYLANGGPRCDLYWYGHPATRAELEANVHAALAQLEADDELDLVAAPDLAGDAHRVGGEQAAALLGALQVRLLEACAGEPHRFALLDPPPPSSPRDGDQLAAVLAHAARLDMSLGTDDRDLGQHGALYFPWVQVAHERLASLYGAAHPWVTGDSARSFAAPPCGHVAGLIAAVDAADGSHRAPAGRPLRDIVGLAARVEVHAHDALHMAHVNPLRVAASRGLVVLGARTLSRDPSLRHIGVRRSLDALRRWLVAHGEALAFEPNDAGTWSRVAEGVREHLRGLWSRGALQGPTPDDAYFVVCDETTNSADARARGVVVAEIGVAPVTPREFIVLRLRCGAEGVRVAAA